MSKSTQRLFQILLRIPDVGKRAVHCVLFALLSVEWRVVIALTVITQRLLFQASIPTLVRMAIIASIKAFETIQFNGMVLSKIMEHFVKMSELSGSELIVTLWATFLLNGANACRAAHKYHAYTKHCRFFEQRISYSRERIDFGVGSTNIGI